MYEFYMHLVGSNQHKRRTQLTEAEAFDLFNQAKSKASKIIGESCIARNSGIIASATLWSQSSNNTYKVQVIAS